MPAMQSDTQTQPLTFDLGHLLCTDPNPLPPHPPSDREATLTTTARTCAQALIAQLLTACPITRADGDGALQLTLPAPATPLPREKPVPREKEKTKWERFAEKKGIRPGRKDGKTVFDEGRGEWVPKYGFRGGRGEGVVQDDWVVEVDDKEAEEGKGNGGGRGKGKERREKGKGDVARRDRKLQARKGK